MFKKMKFPFLKNTDARSSSSSSWAWPSCHQPRTLSFRTTTTTTNNNNIMFKTINSAYIDATMEVLESPESFFTESPDESACFSTSSEDTRGVDPIETVIRGLRSDRLFFEPDETSSILESKASGTFPPFKDSMVLSMDSKDPYKDFRKSMEEMVQANGVKDWEGLEELLCWYLKVNGKSNHGYIVGAFVDLLVGLTFASRSSPSSSSSSSYSSSHSHSTTSRVSFYYSPSLSYPSSTRCISCLEGEEEAGTPSSSMLLEQVKEEITQEDEA